MPAANDAIASEPLVDSAPLQAPLPVQPLTLALADDHVSFAPELEPAGRLVGFTAIVTVGSAKTVSTALALALPPLPVQVLIFSRAGRGKILLLVSSHACRRTRVHRRDP